ncbi:MAG: dTDP-4-dehydrorhamnose reductase [Desulfobacteraceae bacterium]|nr:dTDP-4-dehydrorhamnose reductase [Desulfobacteraceae bacterium]
MRIFVAGARGQLGTDCIEVLSADHELMPADLPECDIADQASLHEMVEDFRPDCILNCAGYTRVDDCEDNREAAFRVNVTGPVNLAASARKTGARLIHISTDYVFDGTRPYPLAYEETDPVSPISYYGFTKAESERVVQAGTDRFAVLRTAWLYGIRGRNFPKAILRRALTSPETLKIVDDQFGSPTWSFRLAEQIRHLIEADAQGIFHASSEGYCSWYEFATALMEEMGLSVRPRPCTTEEYPTRARRPMNSILENAALKKRGWNRMRPWREDLAQFVSLHRDRLIEEAGGK